MLVHHLFAAMNETLDDIMRQYPTASGERKAELDEQLGALCKMSEAILEEWLNVEERLAKFFHVDSPAPSASAGKPGNGHFSLQAPVSAEASDAPPSPPAHASTPSSASAQAPIPASTPVVPDLVQCPDIPAAAETAAELPHVLHEAEDGWKPGSEPGSEPVSLSDHLARQSEAFIKGQGYYKLRMFGEAVKLFERLIGEYPDFSLGRAYLAMGYFRLGQEAEAYRQFQLLLPLAENAKMKAISYNAMACIQAKRNNTEKACELLQLAYMADPASFDFLAAKDSPSPGDSFASSDSTFARN
jgi:tetratricopeptide (TPR) repeat protein